MSPEFAFRIIRHNRFRENLPARFLRLVFQRGPAEVFVIAGACAIRDRDDANRNLHVRVGYDFRFIREPFVVAVASVGDATLRCSYWGRRGSHSETATGRFRLFNQRTS